MEVSFLFFGAFFLLKPPLTVRRRKLMPHLTQFFAFRFADHDNNNKLKFEISYANIKMINGIQM